MNKKDKNSRHNLIRQLDRTPGSMEVQEGLTSINRLVQELRCTTPMSTIPKSRINLHQALVQKRL